MVIVGQPAQLDVVSVPGMTPQHRSLVAQLGCGGQVDGVADRLMARLVQCPPVAALTTVTPDGYPQTSVVWCDFDGVCVRVNTSGGLAKERNMRRNPRVTLLCYDPRQPLRYLYGPSDRHCK